MNGRKYLVLVVDDDVDLLATLSDFLRFEGMDVVTAESGEEGLKRLSQVKPDLIILDISMPGMGGIAFLKELSSREGPSGPPVYVFTARASMEEFFRDVSVAGFMAKPCDPDALLRDIKRILAAGSHAAAAAAESGGKAAPRKLLLAEDDPERQQAISDAFKRAGFEVFSVSRGLEIVENAMLEKPNVIVSKIVMENMNGDVAAGVLSGMPGTKDIAFVLYDDGGLSPRERTLWESEPTRRVFIRKADAANLLSAVEALFRARERIA